MVAKPGTALTAESLITLVRQKTGPVKALRAKYWSGQDRLVP